MDTPIHGIIPPVRLVPDSPGPAVMRRIACLLAVLSVGLPVASGQTFSVGLTTGVTPTDDFRQVEARYTPAPNRLLIGPTVRLRLPSCVGFEAGALRKGIDFNYNFARLGLGITEYHTTAAAWQFPLLLQYGSSSSRAAPYISAGVALRHVSGARQTGQSCTQLPTVVCTPINRKEAAELEDATSGGLVVGGGMEFGAGRLRWSPEVRFTRWGSRPFTFPEASQNQWEILVRVALPLVDSDTSARRRDSAGAARD